MIALDLAIQSYLELYTIVQLATCQVILNNKIMIIFGIDPGTGTTGFGVIEVKKGNPHFLDAGVISTKPHTPLEIRLGEIYDNISELLAEYKPDAVSIEKLFFARNVTTAISVSHARGVLMLAGQQQGCEIAEYTPLQIKQALTGYGKATKAQVQEMVKVQLGLKKRPSPDDAADALAAALTHAQNLLGI